MKVAVAGFLFMSLCYTNKLFAQQGSIKGIITNENNNEPLPFVNILLEGTALGATTNVNGEYLIENISPGVYNVIISFIGYEKKIIPEVFVSNTKQQVLNVTLKENSVKLKEVEVTTYRFEKSEEAPVSKISIRSAEIMRNPGGNRDISKVLQSFPGVASTISFRNDIIIRGGAPNENRFYLDGIEVPNINHFATQGSSGGPVGMINVNFIGEVDFFSAAFPASRGNALSSVLEFKQKSGNQERVVNNFMVGSSDIGWTIDGPLSSKGNYIFSVRRSYLQFLFQALKLPFLPTYNDAQYKMEYAINKKNKIIILGLGALDNFVLNEGVNKGVSDSSVIERNNYILGYIPVNNQWNYTQGIKFTNLSGGSVNNIIISRNHLKNISEKYYNNDNSKPENLILDYRSEEIENKVRVENIYRLNGLKITYGVNYEYATYRNSTYNKIVSGSSIDTIKFESEMHINKYGFFTQAAKSFFDKKLGFSFGFRIDGCDYSNAMQNPFEQFSPRISASVLITEKLSFNTNAARYYQLPAYTVLGYRNLFGELVNRENNIKYIQADHYVAGFEFLLDINTRVTVESFYKKYNFYPLLIREQVSLANLGADFGVIGNAPVISSSAGRAYGAELFMQRTIKKGLYGIFAYTFVRSEFANSTESYFPSSWDNRHILNFTTGKKFSKDWEIGFKFRYFSGAPYTPYNYSLSANKSVWDITLQGVSDYSKLNSARLPASHQIDIRIDKKIFVKNWSLNIYLDIQNIYNNKTQLQPYLTTVKNASGESVTDPANPDKYLLKSIPNEAGTVLPSIGLMIEF